MRQKLMLLPATMGAQAILVQVPDDYEEHEAYRHVTAIIADVEQSDSSTLEDIIEALDSHGFSHVEYLAGPSLP